MIHGQLSCAQRTRSLVKACGLSVVLLLNHNINTPAQGLPPLPPSGDDPPRQLTPEEIEAQRKAQEAFWRKNREAIAPYLQSAPAPAPEDLALKQRLISAELAERKQRREAEEQRKTDILNWAKQTGEEQQASRLEAEALARSYGWQVRGDTKDGMGVDVHMMDGHLVFISPYNLISAKTISTDKARTNAPSNYQLTGSGVKLGLWDGGVVGTNHVEFTNGGLKRVLWADTNNAPDPIGHSTSMSGTMVAAGVNSDAQGMAFKGQIFAYNLDKDYSKMAAASVNHGVRLSNHSYGPHMGWEVVQGSYVWWGPTNATEDWQFGAYTSDSAKMDELAYTNMNYLAVWAMGNVRSEGPASTNALHFHVDGTFTNDTHKKNNWNNGGYGTVGFLASAKNVVSVGAVLPLTNGWQGATSVVMTSFSHWGPTDDGRIAPLVCADGTNVWSTTMDTNGNLGYGYDSGTSPATASVTGSLGVLLERFHQFGKEPTAATLRGLLANTADDAGLPGPDGQFGFGLMNTERSARLSMENAVTYNTYTGTMLKDGHLLEGVLTNGQSIDVKIVQPTNSPVVATLAWTDPPGNYSAIAGQLNPTNHMLVNDLDLVVINPSVATNYPYTLNAASPYSAALTNGPNRVDNIEQILVPAQTNSPTFLTLRISHQGTLKNAAISGVTTNQPFSLWVRGNAVNGKPAISLLTQTGSNTVAVAWYAVVGNNYKVQYIDTVDAPASAWTDATGTITAQNPLTAVEVNYSPSQPQRFYRIKPL